MAVPDSQITTEASVAHLAPIARRSGLSVRTIAEAALLLDVTVLLVLIRTFLPIPGFISIVGFACPLPFVLLALRRGTRAGLIATAASYVLLSTFIGPLLATQMLVFGGLGTLFAWCARRGIHPGLTIVVGATLYGVLYLLPPFLFGLLVLRIDLIKTLHDIQKQAGQFLNGLGHFHLFGLRIGEGVVSALSASGPGRWLLDSLHALVLTVLTHGLVALVVLGAAYCLVHIWAYLIVNIELYRHLPAEVCRDPRGGRLDFYSVR